MKLPSSQQPIKTGAKPSKNNPMKRTTVYTHLSLVLCLWIPGLLTAQVPKKVVVEHFTNTVCSVCASRNPGFYTNLNNQSDVLHVSIHPSSPYASCKLNQHNKVENDARTNYYGVYGSTPRFVIQGTVVPSNTNINVQALFDPYLHQTSPLEIRTQLINASATTLKVEVVIKALASHSYGSLTLTSSVVEETLNYLAPNGEQVQHDVFRKALFGSGGQSFMAPVAIGDSVVFSAVVDKSDVWALEQLYALTMVQESTNKQVVQADRSDLMSVSTGIAKLEKLNAKVFPNPSKHQLNIEIDNQLTTTIRIYNITGAEVFTTLMNGSSILDVSELPRGLYMVKMTNTEGNALVKITISE
jgi:hypothetical protein